SGRARATPYASLRLRSRQSAAFAYPDSSRSPFRDMDYRITIKPSNNAFDADGDETVLEAALRQGFVLAYSCRNGACGTCKGKVLEGAVDYDTYQADTLP